MQRKLTRRETLMEAGGGFGAIALSWLLEQNRALGAPTSAAPRRYDLKPKAPHFPPKAKRVIFIYISGGPSTIDMWDPKPGLRKYDRKPAPFCGAGGPLFSRAGLPS